MLIGNSFAIILMSHIILDFTLPSVIDQDHFTSRYEMFPKGHARIIQMGRPSLRDRVNEDEDHPFKMILEKLM